jgi:hypothetical protein
MVKYNVTKINQQWKAENTWRIEKFNWSDTSRYKELK